MNPEHHASYLRHSALLGNGIKGRSRHASYKSADRHEAARQTNLLTLNATAEAVEAIHDVVHIIADMSGVVESIVGSLGQQQAATNEIASCVNEAVGGTDRVVEIVARVSGAAKHCGVARY